MQSRGRSIVLWAAAGTAAVLAAAGLTFRARLLEEYWLWRLKHGEWAAKKNAAVELERIRSMRAVPLLMETICDRPRPPWTPEGSDAEPVAEAILKAGPTAAPCLIERLKQPRARYMNYVLGRLAEREPAVISLLVTKLPDPDPIVQDSAMAILS